MTQWINDQWPDGANGIRDAIVATIASVMPGIHDALKTQWGLTDVDFPLIEKIDKTEPMQMAHGEHSLVAVDMSYVNTLQPIEYDDLGSPISRSQYSVRVYLFVKSGNADAPSEEMARPRVTRIRDMTELALRYTYQTKPSLGSTNYELKLDTLAAYYSDVQKVAGDRWITGLYHEFNVIATEGSVATSLGTVNEVTIDVEVLASN